MAMVRQSSLTPAGTSSGRLAGPSTHIRRKSSTYSAVSRCCAAWNWRCSRSTTNAPRQYCWEVPQPLTTSPVTRSGWSSAVSSAVVPPIDCPTRNAAGR